MRAPIGQLLVCCGRIAAAVLLLTAAVYELLASIPFAYYHFLQFAHFSWLPYVIRFHPVIMAAGVVLLALSLPVVPGWWRVRILIAGAIPCAAMAATIRFPQFQTYEAAAILCAAPLLLLFTGSLLSLVAGRQSIARGLPPATSPAVLFGTAAVAALLCSVLYLAHALADPQRGAESLSAWELVIAGAAAVGGHLVLFCAAGGFMALLLRVTRRAALSAWYGWLGGALAVSLIFAVLLRGSVFGALMLGDARAFMLSAALSVTLVTFWLALMAERLYSRGSDRELLLLPLRPRSRTRWISLVLSAAALGAIVWVAPGWLLLADWGMTLQKLLVGASWIAAIVLVRAFPERPEARRMLRGVAAIALVALMTTAAVAAHADAAVRRDRGAVRLAVERAAMVNTSLAVLLDFVRPVLTDHDFYNALRTAGDVTDRPLAAVPLRVAGDVPKVAERPPHIVIVVVDSLRPDYVGAYNPAAAPLTPAIDAFARDSIVMRHAFSPYAGTALAEPSIWAGGLIPRFNYVQPFAALNNLERLIAAGGYRRYVSLDEILRVTLHDTQGITNLDPYVTDPSNREQMFKFDICSTVPELRRRLEEDREDSRPVFVYTQPQNLHIRVLANEYPKYEGVKIGGAEFFKPAADAMRRVDGCFGTLVQTLKALQLYDDSIIVLTADHGDAYGESGRWGHAFYLAPETLRIPLLLHIPERLRRGRVWDADQVAFLTDLIPTLYELAGAGYAPATPLLGRPFVAATRDALTAGARGAYLVQSSYSRAFGLLDAGGTWMYVANANQAREDLYDLRDGGASPMAISAPDRVRYRRWLFDRLGELNAYYLHQ
jgi:arylsulfatase A-like enzyme